MMERDERATTADEERLAAAEEDSMSVEEDRPTTADIASRSDKDAPVEETAKDASEPTEDDHREPLLAEAATSDVRGRWDVFKEASSMSRVVQSRRPTRSSPS
jgi:hypothetical protein